MVTSALQKKDGVSLFCFFKDFFEVSGATGLFSFFGCVKIFLNVSFTTLKTNSLGIDFLAKLFLSLLKLRQGFSKYSCSALAYGLSVQ